MGLRIRLAGRDPDEQSDAVLGMHEAMARASLDGAPPDAIGDLYAVLAASKVWIIEPIGGMGLAWKRTADGGSQVRAATTRARMRRAVDRFGGRPLVQIAVPALAYLLDIEGIDQLVINHGGDPMARLDRPVIESFADGVVPDPGRPETMARVPGLGPLEVVQETDFTPELLAAARSAIADEPGIETAALGQRPTGPASAVFILFAVLAPGADAGVIGDRLSSRIAPLAGPGYAFVVQATPAGDLRLDGGYWTERLT